MSKRKSKDSNKENENAFVSKKQKFSLPRLDFKKTSTPVPLGEIKTSNAQNSANPKSNITNRVCAEAESDSYDEEKEEDIDTLLKKFHILLRNSTYVVDYFKCGIADELPLMTGLHIKKLGYISTPLNHFQANQIAVMCNEKKPCATYELDASFIEIKNPNWHSGLNALAQRIGIDMGVQTNEQVLPVLDYLAMHRTSSNKKEPVARKKLSSKATGKLHKIANLQIQLPSSFKGGKMLVHCGESRRVFDFGQFSSDENGSLYSMQYAAWSPKVNCQTKEVAQGYRLVLNYSLYCKNESSLRRFTQEKVTQIDQMHKCLKRF